MVFFLQTGEHPMKSDQKLRQDVLNELALDPAIHATHIGVEANDGIVSLTGKVESFYEKWQAERAAQRVLGVQGLTVDLDVKIPNDRQRSDEDIARAAQTVLGWNAAIPTDAVKVMVENGWVTLRGELGWNFQREIVNKAVAELIGVVGVSNQIVLKPHVSSVHVKDQIDEALRRQAVVDAKKVSVIVDGSKVTLEGSVSNWAERDVIRHAVWSTTGVQSLIDNMKYDVSHTRNF
jgi:osmotically-inducible protein OsmY